MNADNIIIGSQITHCGEPVVIESRPWWLDGCYTLEDGQIIVARVEARHAELRYPSEEQLQADPTLNRYWRDPANEGEPVTYMVNLTDADLAHYAAIPGRIDPTTGTTVIDGPRPPNNRPDRAVTAAKMRAAIEDFVSEGHARDFDPVDKTPYQKGDDWDI